jgi:hypothetical protein
MAEGAGELASRHLRIGWWQLLAFLTLGIVLEALHGFKVRLYLDVSNETRRLLWTLAHAHGVLLALVHLAFAATLRAFPESDGRWCRRGSPLLVAGGLLLPLGFLLGGAVIYAGDPGPGVLLVPFGAALVFLGVLCIALSTRGSS